jgi:hypothetical protein
VQITPGLYAHPNGGALQQATRQVPSGVYLHGSKRIKANRRRDVSTGAAIKFPAYAIQDEIAAYRTKMDRSGDFLDNRIAPEHVHTKIAGHIFHLHVAAYQFKGSASPTPQHKVAPNLANEHIGLNIGQTCVTANILSLNAHFLRQKDQAA